MHRMRLLDLGPEPGALGEVGAHHTLHLGDFLAQGHDHAPLTSSILQQTPIDAVCLDVCRTNIATEVSSIHLNCAGEFELCGLCRQGLTKLGASITILCGRTRR